MAVARRQPLGQTQPSIPFKPKALRTRVPGYVAVVSAFPHSSEHASQLKCVAVLITAGVEPALVHAEPAERLGGARKGRRRWGRFAFMVQVLMTRGSTAQWVGQTRFLQVVVQARAMASLTPRVYAWLERAQGRMGAYEEGGPARARDRQGFEEEFGVKKFF